MRLKTYSWKNWSHKSGSFLRHSSAVVNHEAVLNAGDK